MHKKRIPQPDIRVSNHGSIFMVSPLSDAAREWVDEHVQLEDWQWMGNAFSVDRHYIENLVEGMIGDGLVVA